MSNKQSAFTLPRSRLPAFFHYLFLSSANRLGQIFMVLEALTLEIQVFWCVTPCRLAILLGWLDPEVGGTTIFRNVRHIPTSRHDATHQEPRKFGSSMWINSRCSENDHVCPAVAFLVSESISIQFIGRFTLYVTFPFRHRSLSIPSDWSVFTLSVVFSHLPA